MGAFAVTGGPECLPSNTDVFASKETNNSNTFPHKGWGGSEHQVQRRPPGPSEKAGAEGILSLQTSLPLCP